MIKDPGRTVTQRIEALARISEESGRLVRTFCSPAMRRANNVVGKWMHQAGMTVRVDPIGNLIGHFPATAPNASKPKALLLGSHLDTVRDAGKFDGALGVLTAIECVGQLRAARARLSFDIDVLGFADEEGVRYQSTYLGSRVVAGTFNPSEQNRTDAAGIKMGEAIRKFGGDPQAFNRAKLDPRRLLGYVEVHIEQGPVLEQKNLALGIVTAISGQTRMRFRVSGRAGHAGTVPMKLRQDALCAAAELVLAIEDFARRRVGLVATVGKLEVRPGASNVIPGQVELSLDLRHANDAVRERARSRLTELAKQIGRQRRVDVNWEVAHQAKAVACDRQLAALLADAVRKRQGEVILLPSGAGHDAVAISAITPVAMLFVRCKDGVSHHPAESVKVQDVGLAVNALRDFVESLASKAV